MIENRTWNPKLLITLNLLAAILLISWLWPTTRAGWDLIDFSVFTFFNNSLKTGKGWRTFWTIANWREADTPQFILIFSIAFYWIFKQDKTFAKQRIMEYFFFVLLCFFISTILKATLIFLNYHRLSPTIAIDGAFRLTDSIAWLKAKVTSRNAFPGDHGFVLICATVFYWVKGGARLGLISSILLTPFLFPRLVAGAHWATDLLVGSISMSLITISFYFGTPMQSSVPLWIVIRIGKNFPAVDAFINRILDR